MLDFLIAHCTKICLFYSNVTFKIFEQDKRFLALKDKYKGKRCFIVALGPSLTVSDLDNISKYKEFSFSMNQCYQLYDKTSWRPDFYFISDGRANTMETQVAITKMLDAGISVIYSRREIKKMPKKAFYYRANYLNFIRLNSANKTIKDSGCYSKFSMNAGDFVYSGYSCVTSIIQIAYFMGFREIYLIGQDCGTSKTLNHSEGINAPENPHQNDDLKKVIKDFESINNDLKGKSIDLKIYNATRGGNLEVFPRVNLDEILI